MDHHFWQAVVGALGCAIALISAIFAVFPKVLIKAITKAMISKVSYLAAIIIRILLGTALIIASEYSIFPIAFRILGGISILAALTMLALGHRRTAAFVAMVANVLSIPLIRIGCIFGVAFGAFLVYAID